MSEENCVKSDLSKITPDELLKRMATACDQKEQYDKKQEELLYDWCKNKWPKLVSDGFRAIFGEDP